MAPDLEMSRGSHIEACRGAVLVTVTCLLVGGAAGWGPALRLHPPRPPDQANYTPCCPKGVLLKSLPGEAVYIDTGN